MQTACAPPKDGFAPILAITGNWSSLKADIRHVAEFKIYAPSAGHALFNGGRTCPMLGQDRDNNIARVEQDRFLLLRRDLDEA